MPRERLELADIIRQHGQDFRRSRSLTNKHKAVLSAIECCRTERLGCHLDTCTHCGHREISYNSCRDRHCPKCQGIAQRSWVAKQLCHLLPVPYYHIVFTLPASLFPFSLYNKELIYTFLFNSAAATLKDFGRDPRWLGGQLGFVGILHTWGQTLWHHPHVHFIVAGGALGSNGVWIHPRHQGRFLFPVRALSRVFRGKFMRGLERAVVEGAFHVPEECKRSNQKWDSRRFLQSLTDRDWIVYCKSPFRGAEQVIRYIGRYTHRVALANSRLVAMANDQVRFSYRDYKEGGKAKIMGIGAHDFLQRFLWHVLPEKFHRIRHYGFLANGRVLATCVTIRAALGGEHAPREPEQTMGHSACKQCKIGRMVLWKLLTTGGHLITMISQHQVTDSS